LTNLSNAALFLQELIRCPSITPKEGGALLFMQTQLKPLGFEVHRQVFSEDGTADVENLFAKLGSGNRHLVFAGHTDVVPPGDETAWRHGPFSGTVDNGKLYGRGAVDMKGAIACFMAAVKTYLERHGKPDGTISFLITGDEEGPSINGTDKLLKWADERGERFNAAIVGEPSNPAAMGDAIKNGRRGSLSGKLSVRGVQGHSAYPHLADNPINGLMDLLQALLSDPFDLGSEGFPATNLEITSIDTGNSATNVIPAETTACFNVRFCDHWTGDTLKQEILDRLHAGANENVLRQAKEGSVTFDVEWVGRVSDVFLTRETALVDTLSASVEKVTGRKPELSTSGGTSDARFIKDYCPVVEFGLVGQTMHKVDEHTELADLDILTAVYLDFLETWFGAKA